jgi:LEA14-like dessication related protein
MAMTFVTRIASLPLVVLGLFAAGCASLSRSPGASVSLTDLRPIQASLFETSAELTVRYVNETAEPLVLAGSAHRLYLNGSYVGIGVSHESVTIAPLSTTTQTVVIHLENLALVRKLRQLPSAQVIKYRLESALHRAEGKEGGTLKLASAGEIDLSGLRHMAGE